MVGHLGARHAGRDQPGAVLVDLVGRDGERHGFIEPMALVSSPWSGRAFGAEMPGRLGASGSQKNGQVAATAVEEEVLAHADRQLDGLDEGHPDPR